MNTDTIIAWIFVLIAVIGIGVFLLGCCPARQTTETYFPGDAPLVVVEWPEGVRSADLWITEVDSRALVVGPAESVY